MTRSKIVILDFGSQYSHLIAKRFRVLGYYTEIALPSVNLDIFNNAKGIVFSGGPASIYDENIPEFNHHILNLDIPILGLCYGHYLVNIGYGGKVGKAPIGEFGYTLLEINTEIKSPIFENIETNLQQQVWMSHQDCVLVPGQGFEVIAQTQNCQYAALQNLNKKRFTLQFHCEVNDTPCGKQIFENFAKFCHMNKNWNQSIILDQIISDIQNQVGMERNVLLFLSGGVDSTVTFALLNKALGNDRVLGLHIDNGFMRKNESKQIEQLYHKYGFKNFFLYDASESFLKAIQGVTDPQKKRVIIGEHFVAIKDQVFKNHKVFNHNLDTNKWILAQGTLYPDIIESGGTIHSKTIKTHHNRVSSINDLIKAGLIIEPIRDLYKDEVRSIGKQIGLCDELIMRHPFPGPGLSINVICNSVDGDFNKLWNEIDYQEYYQAIKEFNEIHLDEYFNCDYIQKSILPIRTVGVQGDFSTYKFPAVIRLLNSNNHHPHYYYYYYDKREEIEKVSSLITNNSKYINRVCIQIYQQKNIQNHDMKLQKAYCDKYRLDQLREVDDIVLTLIKKYNWYDKIFQHLTISIPYSTSQEKSSFVLRPVCSEDVMTARFAYFPKELIDSIIEEISKLNFVDALYYDVTNKPPATFGWE